MPRRWDNSDYYSDHFAAKESIKRLQRELLPRGQFVKQFVAVNGTVTNTVYETEQPKPVYKKYQGKPNKPAPAPAAKTTYTKQKPIPTKKAFGPSK